MFINANALTANLLKLYLHDTGKKDSKTEVYIGDLSAVGNLLGMNDETMEIMKSLPHLNRERPDKSAFEAIKFITNLPSNNPILSEVKFYYLKKHNLDTSNHLVDYLNDVIILPLSDMSSMEGLDDYVDSEGRLSLQKLMSISLPELEYIMGTVYTRSAFQSFNGDHTDLLVGLSDDLHKAIVGINEKLSPKYMFLHGIMPTLDLYGQGFLISFVLTGGPNKSKFKFDGMMPVRLYRISFYLYFTLKNIYKIKNKEITESVSGISTNPLL